jgi:LysM repeat protein
MKILKIFGVVVGLHVFALMLIFVNPGCSSTSKPPPAPSDTMVGTHDAGAPTVVLPPPHAAANEVSPVIYAPPAAGEGSPVSAAPEAGANGVRFSPTRPGTAAASTLDLAPVAVTPASAYTVVRGDSLWSIAHRHHLTVAELAAANNLKPSAPVRIGQKMIIPGKSTASASAASSPAPAAKTAAASRSTAQTVKHVVKPGETLGGIARKYQVKIGEIATANNIADPAKIRPGQELIIPGWQAPASQAAKPAPKVEMPAISAPAPAPAAPDNAVVQPAPDVVQPAPSPESEPPVIPVQDESAPTQF